MFQHDENIYCNFPSFSLGSKFQTQVRALIMGYAGNGKTMFINQACNKGHKAGISSSYLTKQIVYEDVVYIPNQKFRIYDTPGTDSQKNALLNALILKKSLTSLPLNLVLIQAKFWPRFEVTLKELEQQMKIFKSYEGLVVLLISHLDIYASKEGNEAIEKFGQFLKEHKLNHPLICYSNKTSQFNILCKILYRIAEKNKPEVITISDHDFYKYFNTSGSIITFMKTDEIQEAINELKEKAQIFVNFFKQLPNDLPNINEIILSAKQYMKFYLKNLREEQYNGYFDRLDDFEAIDIYLMESRFIQSKLEEIDFLCSMKITSFMYEGRQKKKQLDVQDIFRQCPKCKLIWIKVQGSDVITYCGKKPQYHDYFGNRNSLYQFSLSNNKITYKKNPNKKLNQNQDSKTFGQKIQSNNLRIGCGEKIYWANLPKIPNIQQILKEFYKISNFEQIGQELEKLINNRANLKNKIKTQLQKTERIIQRDKQDRIKISETQKNTQKKFQVNNSLIKMNLQGQHEQNQIQMKQLQNRNSQFPLEKRIILRVNQNDIYKEKEKIQKQFQAKTQKNYQNHRKAFEQQFQARKVKWQQKSKQELFRKQKEAFEKNMRQKQRLLKNQEQRVIK